MGLLLSVAIWLTYLVSDRYFELARFRLPRFGGIELMAVLITFLIAMPAVIAWASVRAVLHRFSAHRVELALPGENSFELAQAGITLTTDQWKDLCERVKQIWYYEQEIFTKDLQRSLPPHANLFGVTATAVLAAEAIGLMLLSKDMSPEAEVTWWQSALTASLAASAVAAAMSLGRVMVRVAHGDCSTKLFGFAAKSFVYTTVGAFILGVFLGGEDGDAKAALGVGLGAGLVGDRILTVVFGRVAPLIGLTNLQAPRGSDLFLVDGITPDDAARLAEEGVDSVHALSYVPTARLFFSTSHSLQRICDWQDQALLFSLFTEPRARILRENFGIRGIVDAQRLAIAIEQAYMARQPGLAGLAGSAGVAGSAGSAGREPTNASSRVADQGEGKPLKSPGGIPLNEEKLQSLAVSLGFGSAEHALVGLTAIAQDEIVCRLRALCLAAPAVDAPTVAAERSTPHVSSPATMRIADKARSPMGAPPAATGSDPPSSAPS